MTRKTAVLAVIALVVAGTSAALAGGAAPAATSDAPLAQETTTEEDGNETTEEEETTLGAETTTEEEPATIAFLNQTAGITFVNETPNDTTVVVERAVLPDGGFVVVHATENVSGEYQQAEHVTVGPVLGNSTYLEPGDHSNVVIQLDRPLNQSQTLVAMAHRDTNDNQQYDFPEADDPYTFSGSPVTQSGYIIVTDAEGQMIDGNETAADGTQATATTTET